MGVILFRDESNKLPLLFWGNNKIYTAEAINMKGELYNNIGVFI